MSKRVVLHTQLQSVHTHNGFQVNMGSSQAQTCQTPAVNMENIHDEMGHFSNPREISGRRGTTETRLDRLISAKTGRKRVTNISGCILGVSSCTPHLCCKSWSAWSVPPPLNPLFS